LKNNSQGGLMNIKLKMGGHFLGVVPVDEDRIGSNTGLIVSEAKEVEEYTIWEVIDVGPLVGKGDDLNGINERFYIGDKLIAQKSHVNHIRYQGKTFYTVDEEFGFKIFIQEE